MGLSSQCGSAKAVCKAAQPSGKQTVIGVAILVESKFCRMLESRRAACPSSRYETIVKLTGGGALVGKADMGRKAKSMQDDPLQPHLKMHAPGLLVRDASTR